jgi:selenocysteine lyase/cysteine desulfurase
MGPQGTGAFYVRRDRIEWLKPRWICSHSQESFDCWGNFTLKDSARRFEFGTRNRADYAGFKKALEIWSEIGWDKVYARIEAYTDMLKARLLAEVPGLQLETPLPYARSSGIVTFSLPGVEPNRLSASLMEHERVLLGPANDTMVRVSTHVFNTEEEASRLIAGLRRILTNGF